MSRPILASIHPEAIRHNLLVARQHAPISRIMAVVKANGYGHGLLTVAEALREADGFAVLNVSEAVLLREAGFDQAILLLEGLFSSDELALAAQLRLIVVVHSEAQLLMLEDARGAHALDVFLKLNTGMNRLGVTAARFWGFYDRLRSCKSVRQLTLMTHFATADETAGVAAQFELFDHLTCGIATLGTTRLFQPVGRVSSL